MKRLFILVFFVLTLILSGCATTPLASEKEDAYAKEFNLPNKGKSGVYIYRDSFLGGALKKRLYIDDQYIGSSAPKTYFYKEISVGDHKISTQSEFGNNDLYIKAEGGKNYFIRQYIKLGVFIGGANLETITEEEAKKSIKELKLAITN